MWKTIVEPDRPRLQYGACALHTGHPRPKTHSEQNM